MATWAVRPRTTNDSAVHGVVHPIDALWSDFFSFGLDCVTALYKLSYYHIIKTLDMLLSVLQSV